MRRLFAMTIATSSALLVAPAAAEAPAAAAPDARSASWSAELGRVRTLLLDQKYREAQRVAFALAVDAPDDGSRRLALEMMQLAAAYAIRDEATTVTYVQGQPRPVRSTDEMTLLYMSSLLYGIGSGVWLLLATEPDSAVSATIPFAAATAAPIVAVATVDGYAKLARGVPHAISAGLYLGLGQGVFLTAIQGSRAARAREESPGSDAKWRPDTVAGVLWGSATAGGIIGGVLGSSVVTTPGRVSFTASTTLWSGVVTGLAAGALLPYDAKRSERAWAIGNVGYELGLASGLLLAGPVSPSVTRVRLVDLCGGAATLAATGLYLSFVEQPDRRAAEGIAATSAIVGLTAGWILTSKMKPELPSGPATGFFAGTPTVVPTAGGLTVGFQGAL